MPRPREACVAAVADGRQTWEWCRIAGFGDLAAGIPSAQLLAIMFTTLDDDALSTISGGGAAYNFGYAGGWLVTKGLEQTRWGSKLVPDPSRPSTRIPQADIPVIGPRLTSWGFPSIGAGATDSVNDLANQHRR